jgi:hypothetical protein
MPIVEHSAKQCFDRFADQIRPLIASTLTKQYQVRVSSTPSSTVALLVFAQPDGRLVPLKTSMGKLYFSATQQLRTVARDGDKYRLETIAYSYRLQTRPDASGPESKAFLRWEYKRRDSHEGHCRHHFHADAQVAAGARPLDLDKCHLPSGWVMLEEVVRFLIYELGVKPPCGKKWSELLSASEKSFYDHYSSKHYQLHGKAS